jgi:hypothetical protein
MPSNNRIMKMTCSRLSMANCWCDPDGMNDIKHKKVSIIAFEKLIYDVKNHQHLIKMW